MVPPTPRQDALRLTAARQDELASPYQHTCSFEVWYEPQRGKATVHTASRT